MRILFITLVSINSIDDKNIYADLMRYFVQKHNHVTIVSPLERKLNRRSIFAKYSDYTIIRPKSLNFQKVNAIEKVASILSIDTIIKRSIKKHCNKSNFDLVIYSTPPITITKTIQYIKEKYQAKSYLLLKDIFPQNAVDLELTKKNSFFYKYFRRIETRLYNISDHIGCMSARNLQYIHENNTIEISKLHISPNSVEIDTSINSKNSVVIQEKNRIRKEKYNIPENAKVLVYGGNLGKPQGIDFIIQLLNYYNNKCKVYIFIIGSGTEYSKLLQWSKKSNSSNIHILSQLPKEQYEEYVSIADIGLIFLDYRFTIPNYPSRLLGYLQKELPVLCFTDSSSDVGLNAKQHGYGDYVLSNDLDKAIELIDEYIEKDFEDIVQMGMRGFNYLKKNYTVEQSYAIIMERVHGSK